MATTIELHLLVDWGDEASGARRRESVMATVILHLGLIILILVNPKIFPEREISDAEAEERARRQLTLLYLPSDLLEIPKPQPQPQLRLTPEERKRLLVRTPFTLDPRELQWALPPAPPSLGNDTEPSSPGPETGAEAAPLRTQPRREITRLEDIPGAGGGAEPKIQLPMTSPGRTIEESLRQGQGGPASPPGYPGLPLQPNLNTPLPLILSDTRGVDFGPYLIRLLTDVRQNWYAVIPESVRWGEQGKVVIVFAIQKDGAVPLGQPTLVRSSGRSHLDRPAVAAIRASQPFPPLPAEFTGEHVVLQFSFLYNLPLDYKGP